jgi:colanic acid biosynthesis glycosyl transferase WcaI
MTDQVAGLEILVLTQYYTPEPIGTAPYAADLAEWLGAQGARIEVLTNRPYYPGAAVLSDYQDGSRDRETLSGVPILRIKPFVPQQGGVMERLRADVVFFLRGLIALLSGRIARRPRVVSFCPSVFTVLLGRFATARGGRHVAVVHDIQSGLARGLGFPGAKMFARALRRLEAFAMNRADVVVVLSAEMRQQIERLGVTRPMVDIPIWVNTAAIYPLPDDPARPPTLLYSGNFGRKQGLSIVVELAGRIARTRSDVRVLVRGTGNQADSLLAEARSRNLMNISFVPLLPKDRLNEGLAEGDVHLVPQDPSAADFALPSKLYTVMAAGRPAVATARPGSALWRLASESGAFICVAPDDIDALARSTLELLDDPEKRRELGAAGRRYAKEIAARETVLTAYARLIAGSS